MRIFIVSVVLIVVSMAPNLTYGAEITLIDVLIWPDHEVEAVRALEHLVIQYTDIEILCLFF